MNNGKGFIKQISTASFYKYTGRSTEEVLHEFQVAAENGLTEKEAEKRLKVYGPNETKIKEVGLWDIFLRQFKSPFFYLLFLAALTAFLIGEIIDGAVILIFVAINVTLGFFQEDRARKAGTFLKKYISAKTRVLREGKEKVIDKSFLVPGDIVLLETGDIVPADLRVLTVENFLIDESILSGESVPVAKSADRLPTEVKEIFEAKNILFAGTAVISGEARTLVIATARNTVLGEITRLTAGISRESVYEKNLLNFCQLILKIVISTIVFVFLANLLVKGSENLLDFSVFCIALVVSIIPEALPLVATFALSEGAIKMAKQKVVVKRLSAVEDLGNIEILCADKTGTLTENKLILENVFSSDKNKCLLYGLLASSYIKEEIESAPNPFDASLYAAAPKETCNILKDYKGIAEIPFEANRLRTGMLVVGKNGEKLLIVKGAAEAVLARCVNFEIGWEKEKITRDIQEEGREGKRILVVAFKDFTKNDFNEEDEKELTFLGYLSFFDPLKKTAKNAINLAKALGVMIKIVTGDSKEVAGYIAKDVGLVTDPEMVILGEKLDSLDKANFEKTCEEFSVFARISPQTKYRIVEALQKKYEVGFLGEGVNDAPALKIAHLAIVVPGAAAVSQEAADIILLEKNLKVVIDGIKEGRHIFANINKYIKCTLASNFGNFYSIAIIALMIPYLPMLPSQILLVNLLSDFPLIAVASDTVDVAELRRPKLYQLNRVLPLIIFLALVSSIFDLIFFFIFHRVEPSLLRTLWFIESILTEIALIFSIRTAKFFLKTKAPSIILIGLSIFTITTTILLPFTVFGHKTFHFVSPSAYSLLAVLALIGCYFVISEAVKLAYFRIKKNNFRN